MHPKKASRKDPKPQQGSYTAPIFIAQCHSSPGPRCRSLPRQAKSVITSRHTRSAPVGGPASVEQVPSYELFEGSINKLRLPPRNLPDQLEQRQRSRCSPHFLAGEFTCISQTSRLYQAYTAAHRRIAPNLAALV